MTQLRLESGTAILDVKGGRRSVNGQLNLGNTIDVVIRGKIADVWGDDDGESQEFRVDVESIEAEVK